jgi:hypothetical protein
MKKIFYKYFIINLMLFISSPLFAQKKYAKEIVFPPVQGHYKTLANSYINAFIFKEFAPEFADVFLKDFEEAKKEIGKFWGK